MRPKFANPWWVVVGAVAGLFVCNGPVLGFAFGVFLIGQVGWRGAYVCLAALTFVIAFPAVALWVREPRPGEGEHRAAVNAAQLRGLTTRQASRQSRFWVLAVAFFLVGAAAVLVVAVVLVNRLGAYAYPVHREAAPRLAAQPVA